MTYSNPLMLSCLCWINWLIVPPILVLAGALAVFLRTRAASRDDSNSCGGLGEG